MQETHEIIIDTEFKELLPPLDEQTYKSLEENIIVNGCMFPLVLWNNILIDGHNRYAICTERSIPYKTVEKQFASREEVIIWIISNQVARRNLTPMQLTYFRGLHYNTVKGKSGYYKRNLQSSNEEYKNYTPVQEPVTADNLSKHYKVSRPTIFNDSKTAKAIDAIGNIEPEAKIKILSGDVFVEKKELQRLALADEDELQEIASQIANGTYEKAKSDKTDINTENDSLSVADKYEKPANYIIRAVTGSEHRAVINAATRNSPQIKNTLKAYITVLEDVYEGL